MQRITEVVNNFIKTDRLPMTLGLFGGWGSGKTTLLAIWRRHCRLPHRSLAVPSLIYKILRHRNYGRNKIGPEVVAEIMTSLGNDYADRIGDWAQKFIGINPTEVIADARRLYKSFKEGTSTVRNEVIEAYYTQIDKAQSVQ